MQSLGAKSILDRVLASSLELERPVEDVRAVKDVKNKVNRGNYLVIPGNNSPRWIIPEQSKYSAQALAQWKPYGLMSQCKWRLLRTLNSAGLMKFVPNVSQILTQTKHLPTMPETGARVVPVTYVGSPGSQQKAVVTFVDYFSAEPQLIMKMPISELARSSIKHEVRILQYLESAGIRNVPRVYHGNNSSECAWQSVLHGHPSSRRLTESHVKWLLQLPRSGNSTTIYDQARALEEKIAGAESSVAPQAQSIIYAAIKKLTGPEELELVLVHGDFAPWNILRHPDKGLLVVDWESSRLEGLPFWDLCHFHLMQAHLFNSQRAVKQLLSQSHTENYLNFFKLKSASIPGLVLLYCISQLANSELISSSFEKFLYQLAAELTAS